MESNTVDWINEYLEWMNPGSGGISATPATGTDANTDFVAAYLEWMDSAPSVATPAPVTVMPRAPARAGIEIDRPETLREAILLMALRTESECVRVLRQIVDAGNAPSAAEDLAREALTHAEQLLDHEQSAWHALNALYRCDIPRSSVAPDEPDRQDWPHALESVIADVRALTGRVFALHTH